jgi:hypothetical protein
MVALQSRLRRDVAIDEEMMIPDLLRAVPQVRPVLDQYGLHGCGGPEGPAETVAYFARAHEVPLEPLLAELRSAVAAPARPSLTILGQSKADAADAIYRPFFKSGIAVVLTLGAAWGAYLLLQIAFTGGFAAAGVHEVNAHGHAQIFGWVGLFVMGFAYQAFPRFKHTRLAWPRVALATLWMMLAGLVVRSLAQPLAVSVNWLWWPAVAASVLEVVAAVLFAAIVVTTWRRSGKPAAFYDAYILSAIGWFVVQAVYESVYLAVTLSATGDELIGLVATWQGPLRDVQIHGFALLMILGVSQRIFHHFYGLPEPSPRLSQPCLDLLNLAVAAEVAGGLLMETAGREWATLKYLGALLIAGTVVTLVINWRIFAKAEDRDRSLKFLRAAYIWLLASLAMLVLLPVYQLELVANFAPQSHAAQIGFSHAYYGATRHAITVGFVSLMIVGVAAKVVPTLNGVRSDRLSSLWGPFVLINLGCSLRVAGQIGTDFTRSAFPVAGVSGLLEVTGLALWGVHLWLVMSGRPRLKNTPLLEAESVAPADGSIDAGQTVAAVLDRHPDLLDEFIAHGFTMLTDPALRNSIARVVTIERACRRMGVDTHRFLEDLNGRLKHESERQRQHDCDDGGRDCERVGQTSATSC